MPIIASSIEYEHEGLQFEAAIVGDDSWADERPTVLVVHGMEGRTDVQVEFCRRIAEHGYRGVAVDVFGVEATAGGIERTGALMNAFLADREALGRRLHHIVEVVRKLPGVDAERVVAMGFCFGGLCVLDMARSSEPVRGVVSFHGVLTTPLATDTQITAKIAVFHGWDDPFAPPEDVVALGRELTTRGADWQIHAYGQTMHSFMAEAAANPEAGILYSETSARRAWQAFLDFLPEAVDPQIALR